MGDRGRQGRLDRIKPYLPELKKNEEPRTSNKPTLLMLMQDLKDEGNTLFKESKFKEAWQFYCYALFIARQLERTFYHSVEKEFLATLFCNASLCCLKTEDFAEALKDADMALCCQKNNIKAMYRRCVSLKELGRYKEALDQANIGKEIDTKNNFEELISELTAKCGKQASGGSSKANRSSSEPCSEWLEGTNALITEKQRESVLKNMPRKKKKGQTSTKNAQASKPKKQTTHIVDSDQDSDSSVSEDDSQFAAKMQNVKQQPAVNKAPISAKAVVVEPSEIFGNSRSTASNHADMGLDSFTVGKTKPSQQPVTELSWPLENYDFILACRVCFRKIGEGAGGHRYSGPENHSCSHDILLVRLNEKPGLNWLKIRPRVICDFNPHIYKYKMCTQFQNGMPCRVGEPSCTFAHNHVEVHLWNLDRDKAFNIQGFLRDARKEGIYSSEILKERSVKSKVTPAAQHIPGLETIQGGPKQKVAPHYATASPPPQVHQNGPFSSHPSQYSAPNNSVSSASYKSPTDGGTSGLSQFTMPSSVKKESFSFSSSVPPPQQQQSQQQPQQPPPYNPRPYFDFSNQQQPSSFLPNYVHQNFTNYCRPPPVSQPRFTAPPPPSPPRPTFSHTMPNLSQPPPSSGKIENPFPQYKCQLCCPVCLVFTGDPWYYFYDETSGHQCAQSILAFYVQDSHGQNVWVQVRERASHRHFKGNYVLCHSLRFGNINMCKFRDTCSFAHNAIEQNLWKMEQEGKFDIGEFMIQQKKGPATGSSSSGMYVKYLLDKYGGYFRFICRACFFANQPMISSKGANNTCSGRDQHPWERCKIIAHVLNTSYTPVDVRKFVHDNAFYLMCHSMHFCKFWLENRCRFAHSQVEKAVWMLERDTKISREELVTQSAHLFENKQRPHAPPQGPSAWGGSKAAPSYPSTPSPAESTSKTESVALTPPAVLSEFCRTCWGKGMRSPEDGTKDKCIKGHNNFKVNNVFVALPAGKEIRSLPSVLVLGMKLLLCDYHPKCKRAVCTHPHGQEELDIWDWMLKHKIKTLRELCNLCKETQKNKTRTISIGESVVSIGSSTPFQAKPLNRIIAPGDLVINEHYCQYCGISCNSQRQWDDHCMSEKHTNNVNSDREHQWNYRQPPWGQGNNIALCARHQHNESCQYSFVPDMYNLCKYAHSQEELDEWRERYEWRQMKRVVARERHMFSYTESLLEEYYSKDNSVSVITENLPGVKIECSGEEVLYRNEKNAIYTWTYEIHTQKELEKVALLHNKDRLHFSIVGMDGSHHQVSAGELFLDVDDHGNACYKVNVHFTAGMFGSFSQWVVFDFGFRPVSVRKLAVEIGDQIQHQKVKELRENLAFDLWTSQNREIIRTEDPTLDGFTEELMNKYKTPETAKDVVTIDSFADLNRHNYVHKMHKLLQLEEITRKHTIASFNLISDVTVSQTLEETGIYLIASNGNLFIKVMLSENLTEDTPAGKLVLTSVRTVLLAPVNSVSKKIYEASIVGDNNYSYDGRGKEYIYLTVTQATANALGLASGMKVSMEIQFQMDRKFFCRMHHSLDCLQNTDMIFPDIIKFKPDVNQLTTSLKIRSSVLNEDQMIAVRHIVVERDGYTPPFIMYGPFGTGKTETLAQATMTLLKERKQARILICTQSNSAADLYITKHLGVFFKKSAGKFRMLRLNAEERKKDSVPPAVQDFCYSDQNIFQIPSKEYIQSHHLVLTTVETSLQLSRLGLYNFFTHIFVDEAGQALECEILMPLTLATSNTCVVLTGDHNQIGPTVYSHEAKKQKFDVSILVRLYNYYDHFANCGMTQMLERSQQSPLNIFLSINYRTKPEILRFISSVFYKGPDNLKAYGQVPSVPGLTPLMFYAVQGKESQNSDSTSYLNHAEAQEVFERVKEMLDRWPAEWGARDASKVAVIATYADQIKYVRKMLRKDPTRKDLRQVDVGPIQSFQGKEVRALFITTVRTSNLLKEPHIIQALEAGKDIGDLGFLSNSKLLNTALTRTQSFVAVIGDPAALCIIGECTQVWRTYLKHCTNMKSVIPHSYTYDLVKNMVIQIQMGPDGRVVDMISKCSQENFKQVLRPKPSVAGHKYDTNGSASEMNSNFHHVNGDSSLTSDEKSSAWRNNPKFPQPKVESSLTPENRKRLRNGHRFSHGELSLSSNISCEDIIFQLARENTPEAGNSSFRSEGISITEMDGFAVLVYNLQDTRNKEPFSITTEDEDFVAFEVYDEDLKTKKGYENWSLDTIHSKLKEDPQRYQKCILKVEGDSAIAIVVGSIPSQLRMVLGDLASYDVEIPGQLNRGHALNGDVVLVELTEPSESGSLRGQVKGIIQRAVDPSNRLYLCKADLSNAGILIPINPDMPRIYSLTSAPHIKLARKGNVCVYKFVSSSCVEFSHYEPIDPTDKLNQLLVVRYLTWEPGFTLPLGVVVGILTPDETLESGMKVLELEHNIGKAFRPLAIEESERLFPANFTMPEEVQSNRQDLTEKYCFTVSGPLTDDLEMAISVDQINNNYEIGLHVTDVVAFVDKDSILDLECEFRGASIFPLGKEPTHMLPIQASKDICSLKPGFNRLAVSVIIQVDGSSGKLAAQPTVFRSIVNSKQKFSHSEVEDILLNPEDCQDDFLSSCINVLYQLSFMWRKERLGNGHFCHDLNPDKRQSQHSHLMVDELKILFNGIVAELLLTRYKETTPILIQEPPQPEKIEKWKKMYARQAFNSLPLTKAFLNNSEVCCCDRTCTCVFSYMRQHQLRSSESLAILKRSWLALCQAVSDEEMDFESAQELISNPENMPQVAVAAHKLEAIQKPEVYVSSQSIDEQMRNHYGLCLKAYTNFTNPLRRYISLVVQRLLVAYSEGSQSPYVPKEIDDICVEASRMESEVEKFHQSVFMLHLCDALKARPLALNTLVEEVDKESAVMNFTATKGLKKKIKLKELSPAKLMLLEQPGYVQLLWEERVYEHAERDTQPQYNSELKLDSDRFVCNIPTVRWQQLLAAVRENDEAGMARCAQEISEQIGGEMELLSKNQVEVLSDVSRDGQIRHFVPFTFVLHASQIVHMQLSASFNQGLLIPRPQLLNLTPCLDLCLEHRAEASKCFANPKLAIQAKVTYTDECKYASEWFLPILALESSQQAVKEGDRLTVHSVNISWRKEQSHGSSQDLILGEFSLSHEFCNRSNFQPDAGINLALQLLDGKSPYKEDSNFSLDYLCIRYTDVMIPDEPALEESVAVVINNHQPVTWVGHGRVTEVTTSPSGYTVKLALMQSSVRIPTALLSENSAAVLCTVEWICKTKRHRILDIAVRGFQHASAFAKDIITGRKPINDIDPVDQDNSVLKSRLSDQQEQVVTESYRQPFTVVIGGPGTGKSLLAARLAHLIVVRNTIADRFRHGQFFTQLMICAPTEESLDVITGYLLAMNQTAVHIVRVYSEEIEERDFPISHLPKPSLAAKPPPPCPVMEDLALHHLIRRPGNSESSKLLEQEMMLTMYGSRSVPQVHAALRRAQAVELRKAHIVLCTCLTSARPILREVTNIKQIIVDDAGMVAEVETVVPLVMHRKVNQVVLFGDPAMPLQPMDNQLASRLGLSHSLLQRYADRAPKLLMQFRTAPTLCSFPSSFFYNSALNTSPHGRYQPPVPSIQWPGEANFPSVFCHVVGQETLTEGCQGSGLSEDCIENHFEANVVLPMVDILMQHHKVKPTSILVLTMTQAQASLIKERAPRDVDVCTVIESIGKERDYVILTTVRTLPESGLQQPPTYEWTQEHLGQVADPRKVNLALTRAKTALFIIGNKDLLGSCEPWKSLLIIYRNRRSLQINAREYIQSLKSHC